MNRRAFLTGISAVTVATVTGGGAKGGYTPIRFSTSGVLPAGLVAGAIYYVPTTFVEWPNCSALMPEQSQPKASFLT